MNHSIKAYKLLMLISLTILPLFLFLPKGHTSTKQVLVAPIKGEINKGLTYLVHRTLDEAEKKQVDLIIFEIDTNGGRLDATEEIMQMLIASSTRTVSFVNTKAFSAGAFIAVATDAIYMSPASVIGAATPVALTPGGGVQDTSSSFEEKITSGTKALIKTTAQHKGHPDNIVSAMVDRDIEIEGVIEKGKLLTLTNAEAASENVGLSKGTVKDIAELLALEGITDYDLDKIVTTWAEDIALLITNSGVSGVLMMIGMLGLYLEFKTPGFGLGGTLAILCFALFFWGHHIAGLAGMEDMVLFVIGVVLIIVEILFIPGFGLVGLSGIVLIFISLVMAMLRSPINLPDNVSWGFTVPNLTQPAISLSIAVLGSAAGVVFLSKYIPRTNFWSRIALVKEQRSAEGYSAAIDDVLEIHEGQAGKTLTTLRPSGKAIFNDKQFDVLTEDIFIEKDIAVIISMIKGNKIFVEKA